MQPFRRATIALVALATACGGSDGTEAGSGPPTTPTPTTTVAVTDTTVTTAPPYSSPAHSWFDGIWPDSRLALERARAAFDEGHEPWRADPVATARAYLVDFGFAEPVMGEFTAGGGGYGSVRFDAAGVAGRVYTRRVEGHPLVYVVRQGSSRFEIVGTEREVDAVRVEVAPSTPGTVVARAGTFGSEWQDERSARAELGPPTVLSLAVEPPDQPLVLEVRHTGDDGLVGVARVRVQPAESSSPTSVSGDRLSTASTLRPDGIGPITVGMTSDQALAAAGVPMVVSATEHCETFRGATGPEFVHLVSPTGSDGRIRVVTVSGDTVATAEGIRVGDPEADVLAAHPGIERLGEADAYRLVHRATGDHALVFVVVNSTVVGMEAGDAATVLSEEFCA